MDTSLKRIIAFVIDIVIVSLVVSLINLLPLDPYKDKYKDAYEKYNEVVQKSTEDEKNDYKDEIIELNYEVYKYRTYSSMFSATALILYFGVLPLVMNGQTLGKKIMKLRVVSNNEKKLNFWKYLIRIVILNNIWLSLINIGAVYVVSGVKFYYVTYVISMLSSLIYMLNLIMVMFRKDNRGLHDMVAGTKVIEVSNDVVVESVEEVKKNGIKEKVDKVSKKKSSK
ncbi:uncharacterized protein BN665_00161 [Firmicutes bacterium CAG:460]|nr:RDD family protein [Bacillota bacterium]CDE48619.1 uncharacterized protein BN665_00161 [Firmicutes bacterium CAG:460]